MGSVNVKDDIAVVKSYSKKSCYSGSGVGYLLVEGKVSDFEAAL